MPFALTTVWLANTGIPAAAGLEPHQPARAARLGGISPFAFATLMAAPARGRGARADRGAARGLPPRARSRATLPDRRRRRPPIACCSSRVPSSCSRCMPGAGVRASRCGSPRSPAPSCSSAFFVVRRRSVLRFAPASRGSSCSSRPDCSSSSRPPTPLGLTDFVSALAGHGGRRPLDLLRLAGVGGRQRERSSTTCPPTSRSSPSPGSPGADRRGAHRGQRGLASSRRGPRSRRCCGTSGSRRWTSTSPGGGMPRSDSWWRR